MWTLVLLRLGAILLFSSSVAWAQSEVRDEVRGALEDQLPVPARPLVLPQPAKVPEARPATVSAAKQRAAEAARLRADEASRPGKGLSGEELPAEARDARRNLGQAGQSATGQARAEEVRKNSRGGKPRPPKP